MTIQSLRDPLPPDHFVFQISTDGTFLHVARAEVLTSHWADHEIPSGDEKPVVMDFFDARGRLLVPRLDVSGGFVRFEISGAPHPDRVRDRIRRYLELARPTMEATTPPVDPPAGPPPGKATVEDGPLAREALTLAVWMGLEAPWQAPHTQVPSPESRHRLPNNPAHNLVHALFGRWH